MTYAIYASIQNKTEGWIGVKQLPMFYLDSNVQGIVDTDHARYIANCILNPFSINNLKFNIHVQKM